MTETPALELRNVIHRFGEVVALADATLVVRPSTIHAVLGENGAGKTTLMRVAYGMLQPSAGTVTSGGARRSFRSPADAIAAGIGMVQQHPSNVPAMTVWENVLLGGSGWVDPRKAREDVQRLSDSLGFTLNATAKVGELSVAAQQRLEILKAIFRNARLLILDEPTAILAPEEATGLYGWLRSFAEQGGTAIVVTHKLEEARQYTDELTVLRAGRTVLQSASPTTATVALTEAMIGEGLAEPTANMQTGAFGDVVARADRLRISDSRRVTAIRDATFEVRAGEIIGIAGVEGSGHHELLLALAGRHPIADGSLQLPERVSIVTENRHRDGVVLPFSLTENAAIKNAGRRRGRMAWTGLAEHVRVLMEAFDVRAPGAHTAMQALSGGNQQKFVLARELDGSPQLIVAENPTRGLDIRASRFVHNQLRAAALDGAAVLVYSSDLDELLGLAHRVLVVHAGRVSSVPLDRRLIGAAMLGVGVASGAGAA